MPDSDPAPVPGGPSAQQPEGTRAVAVIGGGLSGMLATAALARQARGPLRVALWEPRASIGAGLAYGDAAAWHLLNVPANRASLVQGDPTHFARWAGIEPEAFAPRRLFARYAEAVLRDALAAAPHLAVDHVRQRAVAAEPIRGGFAVRGTDGTRRDCQAVVIAVGTFPSRPLRALLQAPATAADRLVDDPWRLAAGPAVPPGEVLLLGSGLTMADTVASLLKHGHEGPFLSVSRHGLLPEIRQITPTLPPPLAADQAGRGVGWLLRELRAAVRRHGPADWQAMFESLRPVTVPLWMALPLAQKRRFVRHLLRYWDTHRFRLPPETGLELHRLRARGAFELVAGRIAAVQAAPDGLDVEIARRRGGPLRRRVAAIVNCTGPEADYTRLGDPLIDGLRQRGLVAPDPLGLGLAARPDGRLLDAAGQPVPGLFALGPPLRGAALEVTAIAEIREQAATLAARLLETAPAPPG